MKDGLKSHKFNKGDMVRHEDVLPPRATLGIVLDQDGMKIQVTWVLWPPRMFRPTEWVNIYKLTKVVENAR